MFCYAALLTKVLVKNCENVERPYAHIRVGYGMTCRIVYSFKYGFGFILVNAFLYFIYDNLSIINVNKAK